jgi:hypothetical protein
MVQAWHLFSAQMKEKDRLQVEEMETKASGSKPRKGLRWRGRGGGWERGNSSKSLC